MELNKPFFVDFITADYSTNEAMDATGPPEIDIFEDDDDTPIISTTATKRAGKTGNYRVAINPSEGNGFEKGKSYSVIASYTTVSVIEKKVVSQFILDDVMEIKTKVASLITGIEVPEFFEPDMESFNEPIPALSPEFLFGAESSYEHKDFFVTYYDTSSGQWRPGVIIPAEIAAEVLIAQAAWDFYQEELYEYKNLTAVQRQVQWRAHLADSLIAITE